MYTSFQVKNFRCFDDLKLDNLSRVNLIAGKNNVGKTALLEALFIYSGTYNPILAFRVNAFRGLENMRLEFNPWAEGPWDNLFAEFDLAKVIHFEGLDPTQGKRVVRLTTVRDPKELSELSKFIQTDVGDNSNTTGSLERAHVLRLEYEKEDAQNKDNYYAIMEPRRGLIEPIVPAPPFQSVFMSARTRSLREETARRFSKFDIEGKLDILLSALKIVEPRLNRLTLGYATSPEPLIHGDIGSKRPMPLAVMGDGIGRLADVVLALGHAENGVLLVDEIENGLHYTILEDIWKAIALAAEEFNVQVFATTHSLECIQAAHKAFSESPTYDFRYHRLDRTKSGDIRVVSYDEEIMEAAMETESEVR